MASRALASRAPALAIASRAPVLALALLALSACSAEDPPGRSIEAEPDAPRLREPDEAPSAPARAFDAGEADEPGHGARIASIAMRTWIYVAPDDRSTKLGYLRAGAVVDRAEEAAGTHGCAGGWYRIVPRGYVCVGKGASLDLDNDVVQAALRGPDRSGALPYLYVFSDSPPPKLYFRLPSIADQKRVEGVTVETHVGLRRAKVAAAVGAPDPVPPFLAEGKNLPKPYGADKNLHYSVHAGHAKESSAFGLMSTFDWTDRRFGLTTELDLLALDRTKIAKVSSLHGVVVQGEGVPAFVKTHGVVKLARDERGSFHEAGVAPFRSGWVLTGKNNGAESGLLETTEGPWLPAGSLIIAQPRKDPSGFADSGKKWIDVSIRSQLLVAYEGTRPVYAALVSSGRGGMGDPETTLATMRGVFRIRTKHVSATMDGDEASESFDLRDVPFIQYFHEGYALHGAFWHDDFGKPRSHGCINLAPADAAWLFGWTDPVVPAEWHGAVNADGGTLVYVHG